MLIRILLGMTQSLFDKPTFHVASSQFEPKVFADRVYRGKQKLLDRKTATLPTDVPDIHANMRIIRAMRTSFAKPFPSPPAATTTPRSTPLWAVRSLPMRWRSPGSVLAPQRWRCASWLGRSKSDLDKANYTFP